MPDVGGGFNNTGEPISIESRSPTPYRLRVLGPARWTWTEGGAGTLNPKP